IERAFDREQPIAFLILLADADWLVGGAVKLFADLNFNERSLFLDYNHEIEAARKIHHVLATDRPWTADLVEAQAEIVALDLVKPEFVEGLGAVEIALPHGNDADFGRGPAPANHAVETIRPHEGQHGVAFEIVQAGFLAQHRVAESNIEPPRGYRQIVGDCYLHP